MFEVITATSFDNRTFETTQPGPRRHKAPEGECKSCDRERAGNIDFHPPHDASRLCKSGKHPHCTCDVCF